MSDLYKADVLAWSQQQAALLRRLGAGEQVNAEIDWENVVEEIESVGNEQLHAVESLLVQALLHMLKAKAWPQARDVGHWQGEAIRFRADAARRYAPSMRRRIELAKLYRTASRALPPLNDNQPPLSVPKTCPWTLDELLSE